MSTNMTFTQYRDNVLNHINSFILVYQKADPETWPALRDAFLKQEGMEELSFLQYGIDKEPEESNKVTRIH